MKKSSISAPLITVWRDDEIWIFIENGPKDKGFWMDPHGKIYAGLPLEPDKEYSCDELK